MLVVLDHTTQARLMRLLVNFQNRNEWISVTGKCTQKLTTYSSHCSLYCGKFLLHSPDCHRWWNPLITPIQNNLNNSIRNHHLKTGNWKTWRNMLSKTRQMKNSADTEENLLFCFWPRNECKSGNSLSF